MDAMEKRVIRWKRELLAANITFDDRTIRLLQQRGLIWDSMIEQIEETESTNCGKVWKYLEHLMRANLEKNVFEAFCEFLDEDRPWISSELRVELQLERGQLKIDEYINNEAAKLVHRHFGTTKRISETDKRKLENLVALRTQCTKNIWIKNVEQTKQALDDQNAICAERDKTVKNLIRQMQDYLNANRQVLRYSNAWKDDDERLPSLTPTSIDMGYTSRYNARYNNSDTTGKGLLVRLENTVERFLEFTTGCVNNYEILKEEKSRALDLLDQNDGTGRVDKEVGNTMQRLTKELKEARERIKADEENISDLKAQMEEMKNEFQEELKERDRTIRFLASSLEKAQEEANLQEAEMKAIKGRYRMTTEELENYKSKSKYLEKYRHFGYWYDRFADDDQLPRFRDISIERRPAIGMKKSTRGHSVRSSSKMKMITNRSSAGTAASSEV